MLWLAREGTYIRESQERPHSASSTWSQAINEMLAYDKKIRIAIEPKPNEPMDHAYIPTIGHALALASLTARSEAGGRPDRDAHAILAGLDPSDEMAFALLLGKLWSLHLNDQNGLKFDQDKPFGSANLRVAFNQVRVLERNRLRQARRIRLPSTCIPSAPPRSSTGRRISSTAAARSCGWCEKARTFDERPPRS